MYDVDSFPNRFFFSLTSVISHNDFFIILMVFLLVIVSEFTHLREI
jgi:hypothetical protein